MAWIPALDQPASAATQLVNVAATEQFFDAIPVASPQHNHWEIQIEATFPNPTTNNAIFTVYRTLDATTPEYDLEPYVEIILLNTSDPNRISFDLVAAKFRVGVRADGGDTDIDTADFKYRELTLAAS